MDGKTAPEPGYSFSRGVALPGLLVAFAPEGSCSVDRCLVSKSFVVGRAAECDLAVVDDRISQKHFRIERTPNDFSIEDLGSTNGTFVNGAKVATRQTLDDRSVIRAGREVFVFHHDVSPMLDAPPSARFGMAGSFHLSALLEQLKDASRSARHLLLHGPSGSGKELCARAVASMMGEKKALDLVAYNAARFSSEEEVTTTLFGVNPKVFSGVDQRPGLIEQARKGALFLDEVHNLPVRVQRSLLRVIEHGQTSRIGETASRPADVRFIFASNAGGETMGLAHDLFARLRVVSVPPLSERIADIPSIFDAVLRSALLQKGMESGDTVPLVSGDHCEAMCLDGFEKDNVRGLIDLADRIASRIAGGADPEQALISVFAERFEESPVIKRRADTGKLGSEHYEMNREMIVKEYQACGKNVSELERRLKEKGLRCSRRWLMIYLEKWGAR